MQKFCCAKFLVGSSGLEPPTSRLSGARSNHLSYEPIQFPRCISFSLAVFFTSLSLYLVKNEEWRVNSEELKNFAVRNFLVEMMGFEPMTPCLQGRCSPNWATPPCGSEEWIVKSEKWRVSVEKLRFSSLFIPLSFPSSLKIHSALCILHSALSSGHSKLNNNRSVRASKLSRASKSYLFRFRFSTYDTASCVFRSMPLSP